MTRRPWSVLSALILFLFLAVARADDEDPIDEPETTAGTLNWVFHTRGAVTAAPVLSDDGKTLYVGSADRYFYAIPTEQPDNDDLTNSFRWRIKFPAPITQSAMLADGVIYVPCTDGALYTLEDRGGTNVVFHWFSPFRSLRRGISSPVIDEDGTVYVGSLDNRLYALFPDGARKWSFRAKDDVGTPTIAVEGTNDSGTIYFPAGRNLFGVSAEGEQTSIFSPGGHIHSTPAIGEDGTIFFGSDNKIVYALEPGSGTNSVRWRANTRKKVSSSPVIGVTGDIYIASETAKLYCFTTNGGLRWAVSTKKPVHAALSIGADGTIYAGSDDKQMYAISADGQIRWTFKTKGTIRSAAAIDGKGTIYFGSSDKNIYSVLDDTFDNTFFDVDDDGEDIVENVWPMFRRDRQHTARSTHGEPFIIQEPLGLDVNDTFIADNVFEGTTSFVVTDGEPSISLQNGATNGGNILISITARAAAPLTYQWQLNEEDIDPELNPSATNATLVLTDVSVTDAGDYTVVVSSGFGDDLVSDPFTLTVNSAPVITTPLTNRFVLVSNTVSLNVGAIGDLPLFFQWRLNGANIPGANSATFTFTPTNAGVFVYDVVVTNRFGSVTSGSATVTVFAVTLTLADHPLGAGQRHSLAVLTNHTLWSWGLDNFGQLGDGTNGTSGTSLVTNATPAVIGTNGAHVAEGIWQSISGGSRGRDVAANQPGGFSLGIQTNGTLWAWGLNDQGQLGLGSQTLRNAPAQVGSDSDWFQVEAGASHTLALKRDGTLWSWGANDAGQLGVGNTTLSTSPVRVGNDSAWVEVRAGGFFSLARRADGTLWAWGTNNVGQLGLGDKTNHLSPTMIGTSADWTNVSAGVFHSLAIKADGTLWAWGAGTNGQLGIGNSTNVSRPVQVGSDIDWILAEAGNAHSLAIKTSGALFAWGANAFGQIGDGSIGSPGNRNDADRFFPVAVAADKSWRAVDASSHSLGMTVDGSVWAWGWNINGQVGDGTTNNRALPTLLTFTNVLPTIITQPTNRTVLEGTLVSFTVNATGAPPIFLRWYFNSNAITGNGSASNATLVLGPAQASQAGFYYVIVSNAFGNLTSSIVKLTVTNSGGGILQPPVFTQSPSDQLVNEGDDVSFVSSATGNPAVAYRWYFSSQLIDSTANPSAIQPILILNDVIGSNAGLYQVVASNSSGVATSVIAALTITNSSGMVFLPNSSGQGVFISNSAPFITQQPTNETATAGSTTNFTVEAMGAAPLFYQWRFNSNVIASITNDTALTATLTLSNVAAANAGLYDVIVSNSVGTITSILARLTVTGPPGSGIAASKIIPSAEIHLGPVRVTSDGVMIEVLGEETSRRLVLEYKETLDDPDWKPLGTNDGGGLKFLDTTTPLDRSRYYRVRAE